MPKSEFDPEDPMEFVGVELAHQSEAALRDMALCFAEEFVRSPRHEQLLRNVPVYLLTNEESGLWGAAFCGLQQLRKAES